MENLGAAAYPRTLAIDIGGAGLKMLTLDSWGKPLNERRRRRTPKAPTPSAVLDVLRQMIAKQPPFDRLAVGFPGVVTDGVTLTAANLHKDWIGFDLGAALQQMTGKPVRLANDADVQGLAVIDGIGVELVLTLGTGFGSALYVDYRLVPNLEIAHHLFRKGKTYEDCLGGAALERSGRAKWNARLQEAMEVLQATFNYRRLYLGGGNAKFILFALPKSVSIVSNMAGLLGGIRLWDPRIGPSQAPLEHGAASSPGPLGAQ